MEPDEIKKMWKEVDLLKEKQQISDHKIKEMLKNQGKTALAKLIKTANFYRFAMIPLGLFFCLLSYKFFEAGGYYVIYPLIFMLLCVLLEPLEIYLYRLLKEIDFANMSVKEVSQRILKYQHILRKCEMYGVIIGVVYLSIWYYLYYKLTVGSEIVWGIIIFMIAMCVAVGFFIPVAYKKLYYNHISQIKESLKELKEFEV
ncbi:MAG: hypothetical protein FWG22_02720 [Prolixibacteraceae bacterium]|nr:hypothetical protein [Prolixibacteraceae bacterium]